MAEGWDSAGYMYYLPPELLRNIFIYLPAKDMVRCRKVSPTWRSVIDSLSRNNNLWRRNCKDDFPDTYQTAREKAKPGLTWYRLYRSLSMWRSLAKAAEKREEFALAAKSYQEITNFKLLSDGIIGVLKRGSVVYYDIETLELSKRLPIMGEYSKYTETDSIVVVLSFNSHLFVIRKVLRHDNDHSAVTYANVKQFTLSGEELYFVNINNDVFVIYLRCRKLHANFLLRSLRAVMTLGYSHGNLNVLTVEREIYSVEKDNTFVLKEVLDTDTNLLHQLQKYHFLENMDWGKYFQWSYLWNQAIPDGPMGDLVSIKQHGDVFFVGSHWGVLRIYYAPFTDGEFDIFNRKPIKQYNFMDSRDPLHPLCPILNVEVMEGNDGHKVIIALPFKITVINYTHDFETESPEKDTEPLLAEISKIEELDLNAPGTSQN